MLVARLGRARGRNFGWRMQNEGCREGVCAFGRGVRAGRAGIGRAMRKGERVRIAPTNVAEFDPPHSPKKRCTFWVKPPESFFQLTERTTDPRYQSSEKLTSKREYLDNKMDTSRGT